MSIILIILFVLIFGRIILKIVVGISSMFFKIVLVLFSLALTLYLIRLLLSFLL